LTIFNLQILRGLAALGVVFYHTAYLLPGDWHTEFFGVSTFFVLSGFIMCFITRDPKGGDATPGGFLMRRAIRIVPLYWLCTDALMVFLNRPPFHLGGAWQWISTYVPYAFESAFFLPMERPPMLGVGWTLNFEVYFYVVFAAAILISRRFAPLIAASIVYAVIKANDYATDQIWLLKFYSHGYIHFFLHGIVLFYVWWFTKDYLKGWAKWPTVIACAAIVIGVYGSQFFPPQQQTYAYGATYFPALLVAAALFAASAGADITWRPLVLLGDASYAVYLSHTITLEILRRVTPLWKESITTTLTVVTIATLVGIAVHLYVEKPMLRWIRRYGPARMVEPKALGPEKMTRSDADTRTISAGSN
jgi:exopolysaccharide production protein ExoZ